MKKTIALLLSVLMLTSAAACANQTGTNEETGTASAVTETETSELDARKAVSDDLPEEDYDGFAFVVLTRDRNDFVADVGADTEETGEVIDDAIYNRNVTVEERFHIDIQAVNSSDPISQLRQTVQAGDDAYQLMMAQAIEVGIAAVEGNYLDWYDDLPYVNLEKPWYIGNAVDALSVENHAFIMAGEYDLSILRFTYCMYFNKTLAENYNVPSLYTIVSDGQWTLDQLDTIVKGVYEDLDGNGTMNGDDLYGFTSDYYSAAITYQYAFNNPVMTKDADGIPEITYTNGKMDQIVDRVVSFFYDNPGSYVGTWGVSGPIWEAGHALFINGLFSSSSSYRELEFDFGIIPYPKWDEAQDNYYTMSDGAHDLMSVPVTVSNAERASVIIEALNAESYKTVIPAYYDTALKVKYTRDEESVVVLDMLLAARTFDFGYIYDGWKGYAFILQNLTSSNSKDFASQVASRKDSAEKHYQEVIDSLLGLLED